MRRSPALESQSSFERIQQLVKKEGKTARNLVAWSVPAPEQAKAIPRSRGRSGKAVGRRPPRARGSEQLSRSERMCLAAAGQYSNSALGGKEGGRPVNKSDVHARYWSYLFDNLFRAVDEIYKTCEVDGSVIECQEVMMTLDACHRDFAALIHRIDLERQLETYPHNRPSGVAWEVRKTTSPSKLCKSQPRNLAEAVPGGGKRGGSVSGRCVRNLEMSGSSLTWADRVRGRTITDPTRQGEKGEEPPGQDLGTKEQKRSDVDIEKRDGENTVARKEVEDGRQKVDQEMGEEGREVRGKESGEVRGEEGEEVMEEVRDVRVKESGGVREESGEVKIKANVEVMGEGDGKDDTTKQPNQSAYVTSLDGVEQECCEEEAGNSRGNVPTEDTAEESWRQLLKEYSESEGHHHVSWADRSESPPFEGDTVPPLVLADTPRSPGRAITLHQRLSSPSRKRPIEESKRKLEEKQVKAQLARDRLVQEQRLRSKAEQEKVREARETRESRMKAWREGMEERLLKAEQLRESHLQEKRRKAQDEDAKVSEIAFINTLEAQNRKIQVLRRHQDHEARLADIAEERARRREEATAREEAAQERRRALEEERKAKLRELDERRRDQAAKIELMRQERERAREEAAQEKARERERRLEARNTALQLSTVELERKIQIKQDESSRRHDQQLEQIKEKAAGSRHTSCEEAPCVVPYSRCKWCTLCNVPIISEVYLQSHERGRRHQEAVSRLPDSHAPVIITLDEDRGEGGSGTKVTSEQVRAGRKRARKLRQRMVARWREQEAQWHEDPVVHSDLRPRLQRCIKEVSRLTERVSSKGGLEKTQLQQLDRNLNELARTLASKVPNDQLCFQQLGGITMVTNLLGLCTDPSKRPLPTKSLLHATSTLQAACDGHTHICSYVVTANHLFLLVDFLVPLLNHQSETELCTALLSLLGSIISSLSLSSSSLSPALMDCISYIVSVGVVGRISDGFSAVSGPLTQPAPAQLVIASVNLLVAASAALHSRVEAVFSDKRDDPTSLTSVLHETELVGLLRLLYAMLLHDGPPRHSASPPPLPPQTLSISTACLKAINNFAILDLHMVQACLGAEGISLEFRHVASYLMWHCTHHQHSALLQEVLLAVGYFSVLHPDNQVFLQSGRSPTLLQLLCNLPFEYFSNCHLSSLLFPTLLSACYLSHENTAILRQEVSCQLLVTFLTSHISHGSTPTTGSRNLLDLVYRFPQSCWQEAVEFFSQ